jgi:hypothetical protein
VDDWGDTLKFNTWQRDLERLRDWLLEQRLRKTTSVLSPQWLHCGREEREREGDMLGEIGTDARAESQPELSWYMNCTVCWNLRKKAAWWCCNREPSWEGHAQAGAWETSPYMFLFLRTHKYCHIVLARIYLVAQCGPGWMPLKQVHWKINAGGFLSDTRKRAEYVFPLILVAGAVDAS